MSYLRLGAFVANLAFLALFPGFFLYHSAVGLGLMGSVLGGYRTLAAAVFAVPLLALYLLQLPHLRARHVDAAFFTFLAYLLLVALLNAQSAPPEVFRAHVSTVIQWCCVFTIFRLADFQSASFRYAAVANLSAMTAITFSFSLDGMFYLRMLGFNDDGSLAGYQQLALSYFMTFIVSVFAAQSISWRAVLYAACVATIYMHGARSEFVAVLAVIAVLEFTRLRTKAIALVAVAAVALLVTNISDQLFGLLPENRTLQLLNLAENTSWQTRKELTDYALDTIYRSPFLGDYASYVVKIGPGMYAHNILSAWVDLGLIGFLLLSALVVLPTTQLVTFSIKRRHDPQFLLAIGLAVSCVLLLITAKEFTYIPTAAAIGAYAAWLGSLRRQNSITPSGLSRGYSGSTG